MTNAKKTQVAEAINVTSPEAVANLTKCRENVIKIAGKTGEVIKAYSAAMSQAFNLVDNEGNVTTPWYDLKGKLKKGVNDEAKLFKAEMEKAGFSKGTIGVYWQRVKEESGYVTAGQRVQGASDVDSKTMAELKTIINRIFKAEETSDMSAEGSSKVKGLLIEAFEILGGDVDTLG